MRQDSVLVERVRDLQKQIHELQDRDKQFRQDQTFQLHLYKAERSSKFHFMSPVPTPLKKTVFKELVDVNGNIVSNQQGMSGVLVDYYKDLFAAPEVLRPGDEVSSFLTPLTRHKQLPEQAQQSCRLPCAPTSSIMLFDTAVRTQRQVQRFAIRSPQTRTSQVVV
ncbi:hypothetical protein Ae201684P_007897, partial [Aphanomyces euteiches]